MLDMIKRKRKTTILKLLEGLPTPEIVTCVVKVVSYIPVSITQFYICLSSSDKKQKGFFCRGVKTCNSFGIVCPLAVKMCQGLENCLLN